MRKWWPYALGAVISLVVVVWGFRYEVKQADKRSTEQLGFGMMCQAHYFDGAALTKSGWMCGVQDRRTGKWHLVSIDHAADYEVEALYMRGEKLETQPQGHSDGSNHS
jgi:hypothetical protein